MQKNEGITESVAEGISRKLWSDPVATAVAKAVYDMDQWYREKVETPISHFCYLESPEEWSARIAKIKKRDNLIKELEALDIYGDHKDFLRRARYLRKFLFPIKNLIRGTKCTNSHCNAIFYVVEIDPTGEQWRRCLGCNVKFPITKELVK
jgi:hypothetical protein